MYQWLSLVALVALPSMSFAQSADLSGKWSSGYWISDKNGHNGPLKATFKQLDCDTYKVTFSGRFAKVIPFRYSTQMDVVGAGDGAVVLTAEKRLGPMGTFRMTATATDTTFDANFTSRRDSGRFVLRR